MDKPSLKGWRVSKIRLVDKPGALKAVVNIQPNEMVFPYFINGFKVMESGGQRWVTSPQTQVPGSRKSFRGIVTPMKTAYATAFNMALHEIILDAYTKAKERQESGLSASDDLDDGDDDFDDDVDLDSKKIKELFG